MNRSNVIDFAVVVAAAITFLAPVILPGCATVTSGLKEWSRTPFVMPDGTVALHPDTGYPLYEESLFELTAKSKAKLWAQITEGSTDVAYYGEGDYFDLLFGAHAKELAADVPVEDVGAAAGAAIGAAIK